MSYLPQNKVGDCSKCGEVDTDCRKRGKDLVCLPCCKTEDTLKQIDKSKKRNALQRDAGKVRKLYVPLADNKIGSMQSLVNDLDSIFSKYVRLRFCDKYGNFRCFCCDKEVHWTKGHNSHFIKRSNMATRFSTENCKQSCPECNNNHNTDTSVYAKKLGEHIVNYLYGEAATVYKYGLDELKEMIIDYRTKVKILESKLIIN
ncbi:MAG: recombination protein NinG [Bacteroidia bacterium]